DDGHKEKGRERKTRTAKLASGAGSVERRGSMLRVARVRIREVKDSGLDPVSAFARRDAFLGPRGLSRCAEGWVSKRGTRRALFLVWDVPWKPRDRAERPPREVVAPFRSSRQDSHAREDPRRH